MLSAGSNPAGTISLPSTTPTWRTVGCLSARTPRSDYYRRYLDWADQQRDPPPDRQTFYLFLGNAFANARTIKHHLAPGRRPRLARPGTSRLRSPLPTRVFCVRWQAHLRRPALAVYARASRPRPTRHRRPHLSFCASPGAPARQRAGSARVFQLRGRHLPVERASATTKLARLSLRERLSGRAVGSHARGPAGTRVGPVAVEADDERAAKEIQRVLARCGKNSMRRRCDACLHRARKPVSGDRWLTGADPAHAAQRAQLLPHPTQPGHPARPGRLLRSVRIPRGPQSCIGQFDSNQESGQPDVSVHDLQADSLDLCNCTTSCSRTTCASSPNTGPCSFGQVATSSAGVRQPRHVQETAADSVPNSFLSASGRPSAVITVEMAPQRIVANDFGR